jgi:hypothetical protein
VEKAGNANGAKIATATRFLPLLAVRRFELQSLCKDGVRGAAPCAHPGVSNYVSNSKFANNLLTE